MEKITSRKKLTLYGCAGLGVNLLSMFMSTLIAGLTTEGYNGASVELPFRTYLNVPLINLVLWGVLQFLAEALDGVIDLPLATLSEKINSKWGKRKTGILFGLIPTVVFFLLFLVPITPYESIINTIWFGFLLCGFYTFYTLTMLVYYATFSEVCKDEKDLHYLSNTKSICDVVYMSLCFALVPVFFSIGINVRIVALIVLPLSLTMFIPLFMLKEKDGKEQGEKEEPLSLMKSFACAGKDKPYMYWLLAMSIVTVGLQLFLQGIGEVFTVIGLSQTIVMAASFAPVPLTMIAYNKIIKKHGMGTAFRYVLGVFSIGMIIMFFCYLTKGVLPPLALTIIAVVGGIFVSFSIGAFFSVTYTIPSQLSLQKFEETGNKVSGMYFAVQGLFQGVATGIGGGAICALLKEFDVIYLLPIIVCLTCVISFVMSFWFPRTINNIGKINKTEVE